MLYHTHCSSLFRFLEFFFHTVDITYTKQKVDITQTGKIDGDKKKLSHIYLLYHLLDIRTGAKTKYRTV